MSVAVAITITFPNWTAAQVAAVGTDFSQTVGTEVARLVQRQCRQDAVGATGPGAVTVATTVT